jgi:hypothetical protein
MDLSPDELALLAAVVHGDHARAPLDLMRACHGINVDSLIASGLVAVWPIDQPRPTVTLTPLAAQWLGVEIAERLRLETTEVWERGEDGGVGGWARSETMLITPYWARSPRADDAGMMPIDDPAFGHVPCVPTTIKQPSRPGEYPLPFPDLVPDHRPGPGEEQPNGRRERRRAERARKRRAG